MMSAETIGTYITVIGIAGLGIYQRFLDIRATAERVRTEKKVDDNAKVIAETHRLVNSQHTALVNTLAITSEKLSKITCDPADIQIATDSGIENKRVKETERERAAAEYEVK